MPELSPTRMPCYEAHITLAKEHREVAQRVADSTGWVFSEITGCPILGQGTYCYLTGYDPDPDCLLMEMRDVVTSILLYDSMIPILRQKIEHIVYDTRTGRNEINA